MKRFWEWMNKNNYGEEPFIYEIEELNVKKIIGETCFTTKQMLIGYMEEYLLEKTKCISGIAQSGKRKLLIDRRYEQLKNEIEKIKE